MKVIDPGCAAAEQAQACQAAMTHEVTLPARHQLDLQVSQGVRALVAQNIPGESPWPVMEGQEDGRP